MWSGVRIIRLMNDDSQRAFLSIAHASHEASRHHGLGLSLSRRMSDRTNPRLRSLLEYRRPPASGGDSTAESRPPAAARPATISSASSDDGGDRGRGDAIRPRPTAWLRSPDRYK